MTNYLIPLSDRNYQLFFKHGVLDVTGIKYPFQTDDCIFICKVNDSKSCGPFYVEQPHIDEYYKTEKNHRYQILCKVKTKIIDIDFYSDVPCIIDEMQLEDLANYLKDDPIVSNKSVTGDYFLDGVFINSDIDSEQPEIYNGPANSELYKLIIGKLDVLNIAYLTEISKTILGDEVSLKIIDKNLCLKCTELDTSEINADELIGGYLSSLGYIDSKDNKMQSCAPPKKRKIFRFDFPITGYETIGKYIICANGSKSAMLSGLCTGLYPFDEILWVDRIQYRLPISESDRLYFSRIILNNMFVLCGYNTFDAWNEEESYALSLVYDGQVYTFIAVFQLSVSLVEEILKHHPDDNSYLIITRSSEWGPAPTILPWGDFLRSKEKGHTYFLKLEYNSPIPLNSALVQNISKYFDLIANEGK